MRALYSPPTKRQAASLCRKSTACLTLSWAMAIFLSANAISLQAAEQLTKSEEGQIYDQAIHILGGNANVVSKWVDDIHFAIIGEATEESGRLAQSTLAGIARQTGLSLLPVEHTFANAKDYLAAVEQTPPFQSAACSADNSDHCANFVVIFTDATTMFAMTKAIPLRPVYQKSMEDHHDIPCFFAPFQTRAMEISQAFVYVRQDLPQAMIRTCLQEEIYQSFGLFNDFSGSTFFSFNNIVEPKSITLYDRALLASVYDAQIKPGAPVWRVMEQLMEKLNIDPFSK
ncbi:MAG: DUF2927 domain-containing protein [Granulosicoccus sp.]